MSDFYPEHERNVVYSIYYIAVPVGGAIGYTVGGVLGGSFGWRIAFLVCGIPGILLSLLIIQLNNPVRGINDHFDQSQSYDDDTSTSIRTAENQSSLLHGPPSSSSSASLQQRQSNHPHHRKHIPLEIASNDDDMNASLSTTAEEGTNKRDPLLFKPEPTQTQTLHSNPSTHIHTNKHGSNMSKSTSIKLFMSEIYQLLTNVPFMLATAGMTAGNFGLGGLSEWYG